MITNEIALEKKNAAISRAEVRQPAALRRRVFIKNDAPAGAGEAGPSVVARAKVVRGKALPQTRWWLDEAAREEAGAKKSLSLRIMGFLTSLSGLRSAKGNGDNGAEAIVLPSIPAGMKLPERQQRQDEHIAESGAEEKQPAPREGSRTPLLKLRDSKGAAVRKESAAVRKESAAVSSESEAVSNKVDAGSAEVVESRPFIARGRALPETQWRLDGDAPYGGGGGSKPPSRLRDFFNSLFSPPQDESGAGSGKLESSRPSIAGGGLEVDGPRLQIENPATGGGEDKQSEGLLSAPFTPRAFKGDVDGGDEAGGSESDAGDKDSAGVIRGKELPLTAWWLDMTGGAPASEWWRDEFPDGESEPVKVPEWVEKIGTSRHLTFKVSAAGMATVAVIAAFLSMSPPGRGMNTSMLLSAPASAPAQLDDAASSTTPPGGIDSDMDGWQGTADDETVMAARQSLADGEFARGNYAQARAMYLDFAGQSFHKNLQTFHVIACYLGEGSRGSARAVLQSELAAPPGGATPAWYYSTAAMLFQDGKASQARALIAKARAVYPSQCELYDPTMRAMGFR